MGRVTDNVIIWASDAPVFASLVRDDLLPGLPVSNFANVDRIGQNPHDLF